MPSRLCLKRLSARAAFFGAALLLGFGAGLPLSAGQPAQRICSVTLASDEMLYSLVPTSRLVCVTAWADKPDYSNVAGKYPKSIARIVSDVEKILAQRPDLIIAAPYNPVEFLRQLKSLQIRVLVNKNVDNFKQIAQAMVDLGKEAGVEGRARQQAASFLRVVNGIAKQAACDGKKPRVLHWGGHWTAGSNTTIGDVITYSGGLNAAVDLGIQGIGGEFSEEKAIASNADWLLVGGEEIGDLKSVLAKAPGLKAMKAVRENRVITVPSKYLGAVSPYVARAVRMVAPRLHPSCFAKPRGKGN